MAGRALKASQRTDDGIRVIRKAARYAVSTRPPERLAS